LNIFKDAVLFLFNTLLAIKDYFGNHFSFQFEGSKYIGDELHIVYRIKMNRQILSKEVNELLDDDDDVDRFSPKDIKKISKLKFIYISDFMSDDEKKESIAKFIDTQAYKETKAFSKCYAPLFAFYCTSLITAIYLSPNLIRFGSFVEPRGILIFPLTYVIADIVAEIYNFQRVKLMIITTIGLLIILSIFLEVSLSLQSVDGETTAAAYHTVFDKVPLLLLANTLAILVSDFANAYCFTKLKKLTRGGHLWMRIIGATSVGEALYTVIWITTFFILIDNTGKDYSTLMTLAVSNFFFKILYSVASVPFTLIAVTYIRKVEDING